MASRKRNKVLDRALRFYIHPLRKKGIGTPVTQADLLPLLKKGRSRGFVDNRAVSV
jgi:hypothetical protein